MVLAAMYDANLRRNMWAPGGWIRCTIAFSVGITARRPRRAGNFNTLQLTAGDIGLCLVVGDSFDPSGVSIWVMAGGCGRS